MRGSKLSQTGVRAGRDSGVAKPRGDGISPKSKAGPVQDSNRRRASESTLLSGEASAATFQHVFTKRNAEGVSIRDVYEIQSQQPLGEGSFGTVSAAVHRETCARRAVKAVDIVKLADPRRFSEEVSIQQSLDHPNIVKLYEVFTDVFKSRISRFYLVMELCTGGELFDRIVQEVDKNDGEYAFGEADAATYMLQILGAVNYLHTRNFVHRDIKPENFLLKDRTANEIKVIDFGLAKVFEPGVSPPMRTKAGTPYYVAPQVLAGSYDEKCDIWSCGVISYILLCGYPPFSGERDDQILRRVRRGKFEFPSPDWDEVSEEAKNFISVMLTKDAEDRPSAASVLQHEWISQLAARSAPSSKTVGRMATRLKTFRAAHKLKKVALTTIAQQLDDARIQELKATFMEMDVDHSGSLTLQEMQASFAKHKVEVPQDLKEIIDTLDTDGSGHIDYSEFIAATLEKQVYMQAEVLKGSFQMFDKDGDGFITVAELSEMVNDNDHQHMSALQIQEMISEFDMDGDLKINFEEFRSMIEGSKERRLEPALAPVRPQQPLARTTQSRPSVNRRQSSRRSV